MFVYLKLLSFPIRGKWVSSVWAGMHHRNKNTVCVIWDRGKINNVYIQVFICIKKGKAKNENLYII